MEAQQGYEAALKGNYILQIVLFLICVPTLLYTAFHTKKTMRYEALLREAEIQRNKMAAACTSPIAVRHNIVKSAAMWLHTAAECMLLIDQCWNIA